MTFYDWLLFLHVLGAMVWLGGLAGLAFFGTLVQRSGDAVLVGRFVRSLRIAGPALLAPSAAAVVGFGIWLVLDSPAWSFDQTWLDVALGLLVLGVAVGAGFLARTALAAERAFAARDDALTLRLLRRWSWGIRAVLLILVAITWDMVMKPGL